MTVLSRYVVRATLGPMAVALLVALLILLAERSLRLVSLVVGWRSNLMLVFEMLSYLVPHYMGLALPAAFFLGLFIATARLARDGELDVIQAAGAGLQRYARPLLALGLVLMLLHLAVVGYLQPWGRYGYRAAVYAATNVSFQALLEPGVFATLGRTTWYVATLDEARERFTGLFLYSERPGGDSLVLTARRGRLVMEGPMAPAALALEDGVQQVLPAAGRTLGQEEAPRALTVRFRRFTSDLRGTRPVGFRPRGQDERELTLDELVLLLGRGRGDIAPHEVAAELYGRLARSLSIPFLPLLTIPLALGRRRGRRSYGFILGLALLVLYHQALRTLEGLADDGVVAAGPALAIPFLAYAALASGLFLRAATRVPDPARGAILDRLYEAIAARVRRLVEAV